jgi:hypothetical protein
MGRRLTFDSGRPNALAVQAVALPRLHNRSRVSRRPPFPPGKAPVRTTASLQTNNNCLVAGLRPPVPHGDAMPHSWPWRLPFVTRGGEVAGAFDAAA